MYCIECGEQIIENSKFCSHCGHKQDNVEFLLKEKFAEAIIEEEITRQVIEANKFSLDYQFLKKVIGWYLAWVLLHLGLLLIAADNILGQGSYFKYYGYTKDNDNFWPFSKKSVVQNYDIREFLVYTIFPLAILFIWSMVSTQSKNNKTAKTEK